MPRKTSKTETDRVVWDKVIPQLGVRTRGARVTWLVELKDDAGKRARRSLGLVADLDPKDAREQARALLAEGLGDNVWFGRLSCCICEAMKLAFR